MDSFWVNRKKSKNGCFLAIFGLILAMFLTSQPYDFDAFAHAGAPLGVERLCKILWKLYGQVLRNLKLSLRSQWVAKMMWRCIQCQLLHMTGTSCLRPGEWCNGTLWYSKINWFCNFDMFRNFVKSSNSMCDVALSMWLLFSLFPHFQCKTRTRADRARTQRTTWLESPNRLWKLLERLFWGANPAFCLFQQNATLSGGNWWNESFG